MRVSSNSFNLQFLSQVQTLQQQQQTLQNEATTQLKVTQPSDNPAAYASFLNMESQSSATTQYQANITTLLNAANTSYTPIKSLATLVNSAQEIATEATSGTASKANLATYAQQINGLISQALSIGNTQDSNGNYIFAGTKGGTAPFTATQDSSGNYTAVTYQGNTSVAQVAISQGSSIGVQVPGANSTGSGATGLFSDSRTGADLFNHLIALQQDISSGNTAAVTATDVPALSKDSDNVSNALSANAISQSTLNSASNLASTVQTNLATSISNTTSADLATTLTQLQQSQNAYQAALESGSKIFSLSLLNYLH